MVIDSKTLQQRYGPKAAGKPIKLDQQLGLVRYSPCGQFLVAGSFEAQVRRWSTAAEPMTELPPLKGHNGWVQALAFHPDGKRLFTADSWGRLCCWPFTEKEPKPLWQLPEAHNGWIRQLAVSPDGKMLASCGRDGVVRLWSPETGQKVQELTDHKEDVFAVAFHPDGKTLVSGDLKGVIRCWDLATVKCQRQIDAKPMFLHDRLQDVGGVRCLTFAQNGSLLLAGGSQPKGGGFVEATPLLLAYDWTSGQLKHTVKFGAEKDGFVLDMAWHPAGFVMAVTSGQPGSGKFLLHRLEDAQPFFSSTGMANCHALAVHPNGKRLIVSATNGNSSGNGRVKGANKDEYPGNYSPLHIWEMPAAQ